ncbi:hypothetical protein ACFOD0_02365 [Shewanella intestini]|uniref:Uncharacterized protein n=1 Tax=Shewanella intestini TaxID=2017544 RepID=A0ABS5I287_9GAMM|nr:MULTISPECIES: hypothetical protein [Shewanella]MBR9727799.1 hypothetical protein [Shewanella intestini]MRG36208.1 hypothetical protein [Shewanella sp. XMDDZSB0408]
MKLRIFALVFGIGSSFALQAQDKAVEGFTAELIECASYYQISSDAIAGMNAPQMQAVGQRLAASADTAIEISSQYMSKEALTKALHTQKQAHMEKIANANVGVLMREYKESCKKIVDNPQKRLDYWVMSTM